MNVVYSDEFLRDKGYKVRESLTTLGYAYFLPYGFEFVVGSLLCSERLFFGFSGFPIS